MSEDSAPSPLAATLAPETCPPVATDQGVTLAPPVVIAAAVAPPARAGRYQLVGAIGRGGMGEVLLAHDPELNRPLAVKVMLAEHRGCPELERRFWEEAQIMGQLQHPGVAPIHEAGRLADGRPFFAMKLIEGRTLEQLLKERKTPADDLPRFVAIFARVCQTLAFAHSRGVIHRDLKPANIMVGAFGEVQVMDWGLAKVLQTATAETTNNASAPVHTVRSDDPADLSRAGSIMGTPAFMAPEQARGAVDQLDERTDVFGLGAILCVILTGQSPYRGSEGASVLEQAARGDLADALARLAVACTEAELVQIAARCLAADVDGRPRCAGAVAAAVESYQAGVQDRLKKAELERARAEVKGREERKRRRLTVALAVAVVAVIALGGVSVLKAERQQAERCRQQALREEQARQGVATVLLQTQALRRRGLWREAANTLQERADVLRAENAPDELRQRVERARGDLRLAERLDRIREDKALIADGKVNRASAPPAYEKAFREHGLAVLQDEREPLARLIAAAPIEEELVAALDDWAFEETDEAKRARLWKLTAAVRKEDAWREQLAAADVWRNRPRLERLLKETDVRRLSPQVLAGLGDRLETLGGDGLAVMKRGYLHWPADFWLNFDLAKALGAKGRWEESIEYYRAALAARPSSAAACNNLGVSLNRKKEKDSAGAAAAYRRAIALDPHFAKAHCNLGDVLRENKDLDGAAAAYEKALALDPHYALADNGLGNVRHDRGDLDGAAAAYRRALAIDPRLAVAHNNLGTILREKKDLEGAEKAYRQAISLSPRYANPHNGLGNVLYGRKDLKGAEAAYRRALELNPRLAAASCNLGNVLRARKDLDGAIAACKKAIELDPRLALAHFNLGSALGAKRDLAGAEAAFRKAIAINPRYAAAYNGLGVVLRLRKDVKGAIAAFQRATEFDPRFALAHSNLGSALCAKKDLEGAAAAYREALAIEPAAALVHSQLAWVLREQSRFGEARDAYQRALDLSPNNLPTRRVLEQSRQDCAELLTAQQRLPAVLKGEPPPSGAAELLALGRLCGHHEQRYAAAAGFYAAAFRADPQAAGPPQVGRRYDAACYAILAAAGAGVDAAGIDDTERRRLRYQARAWIRADLDAWTGRANDKTARVLVRQKVGHWLEDADVASVREPALLGGLPADERDAWGELWADVAALLKKIEPGV